MRLGSFLHLKVKPKCSCLRITLITKNGGIGVKRKYFFYGVLIAVSAVIVALISGGTQKIVGFAGGVGLILLIISMLLSGAFISGDRMRANQTADTRERSKQRDNSIENLLIMSFPSLVIAILFYWLL